MTRYLVALSYLQHAIKQFSSFYPVLKIDLSILWFDIQVDKVGYSKGIIVCHHKCPYTTCKPTLISPPYHRRSFPPKATYKLRRSLEIIISFDSINGIGLLRYSVAWSSQNRFTSETTLSGLSSLLGCPATKRN